jgi:hypothetical protein
VGAVSAHDRPLHDRPLAAAGLISYRYRGRFGWVMIGATDKSDALRAAERSTRTPASEDKLQVWSGDKYVDA